MRSLVKKSIAVIAISLIIASAFYAQEKTPIIPPLSLYIPRTFNDIRGFTKDQINEHKKLYEGYVGKRNQITEELMRINRTNVNATYSPFRELKVEEVFAYNAAILHELYFENISGKANPIGKNMTNLFNKSFGSYDAWLKDFKDCAMVARGWVITGYSLDDNSVHNFVADSHTLGIPVLTIPLIVFDVYEHAYMIDFWTERKEYLERFLQNLNWAAVELRTTRWLKMN